MNALLRTVDRAWEDLDSVKLANVWNRRRLVLDLIIDDGGDNRLVKSKRGKLFCAPSEEAEITKEVLNAEATEADAIDAAEADELTMMGEELTRKLGGAFCWQL